MSREPAAVIGVITGLAVAIVGLLVAFGVDLTDDQQKAILGVVAAVAPIVAAVLIRRKVTPVG